MRTLYLAPVAILAAAQSTTALAPQFQTSAPVAYLEDMSSGAVLFERDADRRMPPASMAKMMTVHLAFDLIKKGELSHMDSVNDALSKKGVDETTAFEMCRLRNLCCVTSASA